MRRWLRRHEQPSFDRIWEHAEAYQDAAGETNRRDPMEAVLLSICLGQQIEIAALENRVEEVEDQKSRPSDLFSFTMHGLFLSFNQKNPLYGHSAIRYR